MLNFSSEYSLYASVYFESRICILKLLICKMILPLMYDEAKWASLKLKDALQLGILFNI